MFRDALAAATEDGVVIVGMHAPIINAAGKNMSPANIESTLKGAAIGAAAGTAIAMGTSDVDAVLPAGAEVVIRLDQPITVTKTVAG
mgnify:CR=1 FL=1